MRYLLAAAFAAGIVVAGQAHAADLDMATKAPPAPAAPAWTWTLDNQAEYASWGSGRGFPSTALGPAHGSQFYNPFGLSGSGSLTSNWNLDVVARGGYVDASQTLGKFGGTVSTATDTTVTQEEYARLTYYRVRADCIVQANMSYNHCPAVMPPLDQTLPRGADVKPYDFLERGILSPSAASDIRLKFDIAQVGQLDNGVKLYRFRYIGSDQAYVGVMAQQVAAIVPEAVVMEPNGYLGVYYDRLGLKLQTWQEWQARKSAIVNQ